MINVTCLVGGWELERAKRAEVSLVYKHAAFKIFSVQLHKVKKNQMCFFYFS